MKSLFNIVTILLISFLITGNAFAADPEQDMIKDIELVLKFEPAVPQPVMEQLHSMILATLRDVLIEQNGGVASFKRHLEQVRLALMEGINVVLDPKGFNVRRIDLEFDSVTDAEVFIIPAGGSGDEPGPVVTGLDIVFNADEFPDFWRSFLIKRLEHFKKNAIDHYLNYVLGLPLAVADQSFIVTTIGPHLLDTSILRDAFPEFSITSRYELGPTTHIYLSLGYPKDPIQRLRVRMSGDTVPNVVLDALRDAITSRSDVVVGMPRELVAANFDDIGEFYALEVENDSAGALFEPVATISFRFDERDGSLIAICNVRSSTFDVNLRAYIDFGLEDSDSSEVEGRFGYFVARDVEVMLVMNLFTNDMTLEPDALLGWRPADGSFFAGGYDLEAKDHKFFATQKIVESLFCEAELFGENARNQYGVFFQFHQFFSGGVYATGEEEFWFRATFRL